MHFTCLLPSENCHIANRTVGMFQNNFLAQLRLNQCCSCLLETKYFSLSGQWLSHLLLEGPVVGQRSEREVIRKGLWIPTLDALNGVRENREVEG